MFSRSTIRGLSTCLQFNVPHGHTKCLAPSASAHVVGAGSFKLKNASLGGGLKLENVQPKTNIESWGLHLTIDAANCNPKAIRSRSTIDKFTRELVRTIDMKAFGEPQIVMFGDGNKKGYTLVQLIETSNICAHFCEENNTLYFDLFSCKYFSKDVVKQLLYNYFQPVKMTTMMRRRDAETPELQ